jgi:hypothetical protein
MTQTRRCVCVLHATNTLNAYVLELVVKRVHHKYDLVRHVVDSLPTLISRRWAVYPVDHTAPWKVAIAG